MASAQGPVATNLLAGSHHQSFQNADFRTAGNNMYMPTYNLHLSVPGSFGQIWSRIRREVFEFFQSPENRGSLLHSLSNSEPVISSTEAQFINENEAHVPTDLDSENPSESSKSHHRVQSSDGPDQSQHGHNIVGVLF
jgi:hypothetical protein